MKRPKRLMPTKSFFHPKNLWLLFIAALVVAIVLWYFIPFFQQIEVYGVIVTTIVGAFFFWSKQHLEKARFFKELVMEFCRRYDELNDDLFASLDSKDSFSAKQKMKFMDYFNLCAEEYLFYKEGYIYECVWNTWYTGMRQFSKDERVRELWAKDGGPGSYYGFEFPCQ